MRGGFRFVVVDADVGARGGERFDDGAADSARAAGDDGALVIETELIV